MVLIIIERNVGEVTKAGLLLQIAQHLGKLQPQPPQILAPVKSVDIFFVQGHTNTSAIFSNIILKKERPN